MRTSSLVALFATLPALATTFACSSPNPESSKGGTTASELGTPVSVMATIPTGVQCLSITVTGADSETVSTTIPTGSASVPITLGLLVPGPITVTANAFASTCPGTGTPAWTAEPVQATVVDGIATQIPLVLRPNMQSSGGTATFSLPAIAIAAGPRTSYAILSDGTVRAWGSNDSGQFGYVGASSLTPVAVPGVTGATQIAAGDTYACVTRADLSVMCWGLDNTFDATPATYGKFTPPVAVPGLFATHISALEGGLAVIGGGPAGVVGTYSPSGNFSGSGWYNFYGQSISIAAGAISSNGLWYTSCWVTAQGLADCNWGANGDGVNTYASPAAQVFAGAEGALPSACALLVNGNVSCWGANSFGELGIGSFGAPTQATTAPNLHGVTSMALSRGTVGAHACAVVAGGLVYCAGNNQHGQLGNDTLTPNANYQPVMNLTGAVEVAAGQSHSCARDTQGTVHCWGTNDDGELGDGTITTRFAPVTVSPW